MSRRLVIGGAVLIVVLIIALFLSTRGTDTESTIATSLAQTQQISQLETAVADGAAAPDQGDEEADADSAITPSITFTPRPDIPQVLVSQDTNCRTGPAIYYSYITTAETGVFLEVVGVHADGNDYVIIKNPNAAGNCWLWLRYADKTDFSSFNLTSYTTPPTPTPTNTPTPTYTPTPSFDWSGTWNFYILGNLNSAVLIITQTGNSITGSFPSGGGSVSIAGSLSANFQVATGTWDATNGDSGTFNWQIKSGNPDQFIGNIGGFLVGDWCGARNGAPQPSPCLWP